MSDPQVSVGVKRRRPKSIDDAVAATLELEACSKTGPERVVLVRNLPVQWLRPCARARRVSRDELVDKLGELS